MKHKVYTKAQRRCRRSHSSNNEKSYHAGSSKAVFCPSRFYKNSEQFKKKRGF